MAEGLRRSLGFLIWVFTGGAVACGAPATDAPPAPQPQAIQSSELQPSAIQPPAASPPSQTAASELAGPPNAARLHKGLDVSGHSGEVDWSLLAKDGHSFVFVKATEGMDLRDPSFDRHWAGAKEAGIIRGAYHFYVTEDDPEKQAQFFTATVELEPGDLAPVVDIEILGHGTEAGLPQRLKRFLDLVEAHYGIKPIIYTAPNFWDEHLTADFGDYPLWVAEYGVEEPRLPNGWSSWHLWQWQGDATVPGVEQGADLSHVNRAGPDLSILLVPD